MDTNPLFLPYIRNIEILGINRMHYLYKRKNP